MSVTILQGDCRERMAELDAESIDSAVTDPPYHLTSIVKRFGAANAAPAMVGKSGAYARASKGFMGQQWDGGDVAFQPETWAAVYRVLKPGAHLVAFSGTRTYHRMVCAIEDAGFEIRDQLAWVYGSGFPKSHNQPGGWGTALKPAWEPIVLARKPLAGTVAANMLRFGTGALNIDATRIGTTGATSKATSKSETSSVGKWLNAKSGEPIDAGRWPANIVHDGSDEVMAGFPESDSGGGPAAGTPRTKVNTYNSATVSLSQPYGANSGSAARFFYTSKAGPLDRLGSRHPTVKPVDLMRWLCRVVTPPGGMILDPFAGSGSTGIAALAEGFGCTMFDIEAAHVADIERKLAIVNGDGAHMLTELHRYRDQKPLGGLFGSAAA